MRNFNKDMAAAEGRIKAMDFQDAMSDRKNPAEIGPQELLNVAVLAMSSGWNRNDDETLMEGIVYLKVLVGRLCVLKVKAKPEGESN